MNSQRHQTAFETYVSFIVRHRVGVVVTVLLITAALATQLPYLHLDIGRRAQLPQDHPYVQIQNRIADLFGGETLVIVGVVANQGSIYHRDLLQKIDRMTDRILHAEGVVESSVFSIASPHVKSVVASSDGMVDVHALMNEIPHSEAEVQQLRQAVEADRLYRGVLISEDETAALILADFDDHLSDKAIAREIEAIIEPEVDPSITVALAGGPILRAALGTYVARIALLFPLAVLIVALVHYEAFRTLQGMVLPIVTALLSVVWALGIMGALRLPMDTWSAITPVVILAIAAGHAVQILKRYYEEYARCGDSDVAVVKSLAAAGPVTLTAGLAAAAGFGSLASFGVSAVRAFGLLMGSGILSALVIEMTFTPACRSLLWPPGNRELRRERQSNWIDRAVDRLAVEVMSHPARTIIFWAGVLAIATLGMRWLAVDNSFRSWFPERAQVHMDDALLNEKFPGTSSVRILIEGNRWGVINSPPVLRAMSDLQEFMGADGRVAGIVSAVDYVKRMNQAMNAGDVNEYRIPDNENLTGEYLFLYSMSGPDELSALVDGDQRRAVIRGLSKTDSAAFSRDFLRRLSEYAERRFADLPVNVGVAGGTLAVQTAMNDVVVHEKVSNMVQVGGIIFLLASLILRSLVGGMLVLIPLLLAVVVNLGIMGWSGTYLDMTTAAISAMGISIGADFAIYLIFRMREETARGARLEDAVGSGIHTSGKAIVFVASAVVCGYLVFLLSGFSLWDRLGALTASIVTTSALATISVVPALVLLVRPRFLCVGSRQPTSPRGAPVGAPT